MGCDLFSSEIFLRSKFLFLKTGLGTLSFLGVGVFDPLPVNSSLYLLQRQIIHARDLDPSGSL